MIAKNLKATVLGLALATGLVSFITSTPAQANVSLRNGNFFIGYVDLVYPGGYEPKIERVYNSKSNYRGFFGFGWGSEYEAYLTISADGSVIMHEFGGGAENRFLPVKYDTKELEKAVLLLTETARKSGTVGSPKDFEIYKSRLKADAIFRNDEWENFVRQGKLQRRELPVGTQLVSNEFAYQYITKTKDGYQRKFDSGKLETFDTAGKLTKVQDTNGNFVQLTYMRDGKLEKMIDNMNRRIIFSYNNLGLIEKIAGENNKTATYSYNSAKELVQSKDSKGNVYKYKYSDDKLHNMTEIGYEDGSNLKVAYFGKTQNFNVKSVKDRDGALTEYAYKSEPTDRSKFFVGYKVKNKEGKVISNSDYEYYFKVKPTGETWTERMVTVLDGEKTDTTYDGNFGLPTKITRAGETTTFKYDVKGRVVEKTTPTEVSFLQYHKTAGKVSRVEHKSKLSKYQSWSQFDYDDKGNLIFAKNSDKQAVKLIYDRYGRVLTMVDQSNRKINFKYNEFSKPTEITDPSVGTIKVSYTNSGEVKNVESTAGRKIALQVTSAFQNLLNIIRPAGVTLSF